MANTLLTPQVIANELLRRFKNNLAFAGSVYHDYDDEFAKRGAKIGDTFNLRLPVRFNASDGATLVPQDVTELKVPLVINKQKHVAFSFGSKDLTLTVDRFGDRYLNSAAVPLANIVDTDGLTLAYQSIFNAVGAPATIPTALKTYNQAGAKLDKNGCPFDEDRTVIISPDMQVEIVDTLKGLFQSTTQIKSQYEKGRMGTAAGFDWKVDQNVRTHTVGPLGGTPLVDGATQTGASLLTKGWTTAAASRLKKGDIFTLASVYSVNPVSKDILPDLQQFVVTADFSSDASGNGSVAISPSIVTSGAYQTVNTSPADGAALTILGAAGALSPQGLAFHRKAFVFGMVEMEMPQNVHFSARATDKETGMSIRIISQYDITNDVFWTRCDILYGWAAALPQWGCRIAS
jgi:hypothetical protein